MCGKKSSIISSKGHCWLVYGGSGVHWQLIVSAVLACRPRLGRVTLVTRSWTVLCGNTYTDSLALAFVHGAALLKPAR